MKKLVLIGFVAIFQIQSALAASNTCSGRAGIDNLNSDINCAAYNVAGKNKKSNLVLKLAWTATTAVCTAACASLMLGQGFCTASNMGSGTLETILTQQGGALAQSLMSTAGGFFMNGGMKQFTDFQMKKGFTSATGKLKINGGACLTAGQAGIQAVNKWKGANVAASIQDETLAEAEKEESGTPTNGGGSTDTGSNSTGGGGGNNSGGTTGNGGGYAGSNPGQGTGSGGILNSGNGLNGSGLSQNGNSACDGVKTDGSSSASAILNCAVQLDPNLGKLGVTPDNLAKDFKDATGQSLDDFMKNNPGIMGSGSPSSAIGNALASTPLGLDGAKALADKFQDAEKLPAGMLPGAADPGTYAAGGGGGHGGSGSGSDQASDPLAAIQDLMQQAMGQNPEGAAAGADGKGGAGGLADLSLGGRSPASDEAEATANNVKITIFSRISKRYGALSSRFIEEERRETLERKTPLNSQ